MTLAIQTRTHAYNLGSLTRIPRGEGRTYYVNGKAIAIFRTRDDEVFATQAFCPHKGGPLADGIIGACKVICPLHAYQFSLKTGQPLGNACQGLKTYPVSLSFTGDILLSLVED
jgi:nitrite reductase (NADH) small subunit